MRSKFLFSFFTGILILKVSPAFAAVEPVPFQLSMLNTQWYESPLPLASHHLAALYRSPVVHDGVQGTLSVRIDEPTPAMALDPVSNSRTPAALDIRRYGQHWMNDFPRFGFTVLKSETRQLNGDTVVVAHLRDTRSDRLQRQMLRTNGQQVAILTCTDHANYFTQTVKACEVLFNTFRWVAHPKLMTDGLLHAPAVE